MNIKLNGEEKEATAGSSLADFIADLKISTSHCATAINGAFIPRSQYQSTVLNENDELEIVAPMQGG